MRVVYIAGPLWAATAAGRALNILRAARWSWRWWRWGNAVICPHMNSGVYGLAWGGVEGMARWLDGCLAMIDRLDPSRDLVFFLRGWEYSSGASIEMGRALARGLQVRFEDSTTGPALAEQSTADMVRRKAVADA